jgi:exonuclease VII small subunit
MINEEVEKDKLTKYQLLVQLKTLYTIVDKLEQRIAKLEKVLESHAKCIGELREDKNDIL